MHLNLLTLIFALTRSHAHTTTHMLTWTRHVRAHNYTHACILTRTELKLILILTDTCEQIHTYFPILPQIRSETDLCTDIRIATHYVNSNSYSDFILTLIFIITLTRSSDKTYTYTLGHTQIYIHPYCHTHSLIRTDTHSYL